MGGFFTLRFSLPAMRYCSEPHFSFFLLLNHLVSRPFGSILAEGGPPDGVSLTVVPRRALAFDFHARDASQALAGNFSSFERGEGRLAPHGDTVRHASSRH